GIDPFKKLYHCFGCQASGDVFRFVMETEGLDFTGALESLAQRSGVELETEAEDPQAAQRRRRRERLYTLLGRAADYYARYLWEARAAGPAPAGVWSASACAPSAPISTPNTSAHQTARSTTRSRSCSGSISPAPPPHARARSSSSRATPACSPSTRPAWSTRSASWGRR